METALRRIADMLGASADAVAAWFATGAWRPEAWPGITWALVAALVVLTWLLVWRRRAPRPLDVRPPQLLVTSGEVVPDGAEEIGGRRGRRRRVDPSVHAAAGTFVMTVSNLSRYPVQLLEVALRDDRRGAPRVASVDAVVPAMGSVSVSGRVPLGLRGDGWLDLYCYAAAPRVKVHRHRVELVWEPWAARFKAAPLEQVSAPVRRLASDEPDARFLEDDAPAPTNTPTPVPPQPASPPPASPQPASPPTASPPPASPSPASPPTDAAQPVVAPPVAPPSVAPPHVSRQTAAPTPAPPAAQRPRTAPVAPNGAPERAGRVPAPDPAPAPVPEPVAEPPGVPRIATPPVGVAITGRGGAAAWTPDGRPIGRPTERPAPPPAAPDDDEGSPRPRAVAPEAATPTPVPDEPQRSDVPARRRPRLEFPDEF